MPLFKKLFMFLFIIWLFAVYFLVYRIYNDYYYYHNYILTKETTSSYEVTPVKYAEGIVVLYRFDKKTGQVDQFNPLNCNGWVTISDSGLVTSIDIKDLEEAEKTSKKMEDYYIKKYQKESSISETEPLKIKQ